MGHEFDETEYVAETSFLENSRRIKIQQEAKSGMWTMKNGTRIAITDMTDSHLINTYRLLEKNNVMDINLPWLIVMQKEIVNRGIKYDFEELFF